MNHLLILPFIVPLATAVLSILLRKTGYRDYLSFSGSLAYIGIVLMLSSRVISEGVQSYQAGGWAAPYGITLVADPLSVFMLLMTATVSTASNLYSWGHIKDAGKESGYYAFFHLMVAGMSGAFITGDLFNLFVMFEIVLMSSYAMVSYSGTRKSLFTSLKYVVLNLIGSSLMLVAIGGLYSVTGTLNMADMALILSEGSVNMAPVLGLVSILFCVFAIKSGLVPFHFWAPPVYTNSPAPASAMMAGISKKVGIYAIIRLYLTVFAGARVPQSSFLFAGEPIGSVLGPLIGFLASMTIIIGGTSAINRQKLEKMLSYSSIGQVGFIFIPVGIAMASGSATVLTASLVYLLGHSIAKSMLFMVSGIIERMAGTTNLEKLGGLSESSFLLSSAFFIPAFSLIGIPPLLGFFGKLTVLQAAFSAGKPLLLLVILFGSTTTLIYFGKAWLNGFFGEPVDLDASKVSRKEIFAVMILCVMIIALGINFEPVYRLAKMSAESALNPETYIQTVMEGLE